VTQESPAPSQNEQTGDGQDELEQGELEQAGQELPEHEVADIPEHCLRWCFEVLAPAAPDTPPYDLCHALPYHPSPSPD